MIRLVIVIMLLFLIWVLFVSDFKRKLKIIVAAAAVLLCAVAIGFDVYSSKPKSDVVAVEQVSICGVESRHSYRTNYDITVCLRNDAESGTLKRLRFTVVAERCVSAGNCSELSRVLRDIPIDLPPQQSLTMTENLSFKQVLPTMQDVVWRVTVDDVKAL